MSKIKYDSILGKLRKDDMAAVDIRAYYFEPVFATSGTLIPPTNSTLVMDVWADGVDALVTSLDASGIPTFVTPKDSGGQFITATLDSAGDWTISNPPVDGYPIGILYCYQTAFNNFNPDLAVSEVFYQDTADGSNIIIDNSSFVTLTGDTSQDNFDQIDNNLTLINNVYDITGEPTGFTSPEDITVTYDVSNRTVTLTGTVEAYHKGSRIVELTNGWVSPAHSATLDKQYFLVYNGSAFVWVDLSVSEISFEWALIAYVNYSTNDKWALRECHGLMQWQSHRADHYNIGTYRRSGGTLADYTLSSTTVADRQPTISATVIYDEDVPTQIPALSTASYTHYYISGTDTPNFTTGATNIVPLSTNQPYYNQFTGGVWQQTLLTNNQYMAVWLVAIPVTSDTQSQQYRYIWQQGQFASANLDDVNARTVGDLDQGQFGTLTPESVYVAKVILRYQGGNWTLTSVETLTGSRYSQISSPGGAYLSTVTTDASLVGLGTVDSPLSVVDNFVNTSGDVMNGDLTLNGSLIVNTSANFTGASIIGFDHSSLSNIEAASAGVTDGHISDSTQTIAGAKTFSSNVTVSSLSGSANSTVTVDANGKLQVSYSKSVSISDTGITTTTTIDTITHGSTIGTAKWLVVMNDGTTTRSSTIDAAWNGSSTDFTESCIIELGGTYTGATLNFTNSGADNILQISVSSGTHDIKLYRISIQ